MPLSLGTYLVGPADEGGVGGSLEVEPAELPEHYGIGDEMLRLFVAPFVEAFDYQHPKDHLYRCGVSPEPPRVGVALGKVGFHIEKGSSSSSSPLSALSSDSN